MLDDATPEDGRPARFARLISDLNALKAVSGVLPETVQKIQAGVAAIGKMSAQQNIEDFSAVLQMGKAVIQLYHSARESETPPAALLAAFEPFANHDNNGFPEGITFFIYRYLGVYINRYGMQTYNLPVPQWVRDGMLDLMEMCGDLTEISRDHGYFIWMFSRHWESVKARLATLSPDQRERVYSHIRLGLIRSRTEGFGAPMTPTDGTLAEQRVHWARTHIQP